MKNKIFFLLLSSFTLIALSCKKEENRVILESGTPPLLTASSTTPMVLVIANAGNSALRFNWTNPNYKFNTGVSSHDVGYSLQIDTTGSNFSNPRLQEVSISKDLSKEFTVKELNSLFGVSKLNLLDGIPHNVEFRLKASLVGGAAPLYSNVIKMVITPYLDVAVPVPPTGNLYITGSGVPSDWTNSPPATQKFTKISNTEYSIIMNFASGKEYKFLSTPGFWQPQYGGSSATGGNLGFNMGLPGQSDPPSIPTPSVAGTYKITVNFIAGQYTVVKQ
jgi:hypothetical protein